MKTALSVVVAGIAVSNAFAQSQSFKIGDAGGMKVSQTFSFSSTADFENFTGQTHKVTGQLSFDPAKRTGSGKIVVDLKSIDTGIPLRNEHLNSPDWFNTAKHPTAIFETTSVKHKSGENYDVTGKLTLHGVTKTIKTTATVKYLKESEGTRRAMFKGNVVNLKVNLNIRLSDYGVKIPDMAKGKVAETISTNLNVFGFTG